ncbi:hypothetical protein GTS_53560 [Gandjariella thermophila]|uniref:Uncharacterized protein n=1 Tax=Gandjariella thermophila TaxID=1931992 RepID=A0A4D4JIK5_9PSEU|nr:hypothetical protein GTS_53560 [Gandjariella thermophila]
MTRTVSAIMDEDNHISEKRLRAQIAAHTSWAATPDRQARTAPGTQAFLERFERLVDPEQKLCPEERRKRAQSLLRAHMQRLALLSIRARKERGHQKQAGSLALHGWRGSAGALLIPSNSPPPSRWVDSVRSGQTRAGSVGRFLTTRTR